MDISDLDTESGVITSSLKSLVGELCKEGSHLLPNFAELLDEAVHKTLELRGELGPEQKGTVSALENAAVLLWNKTVVMKTKGSLSVVDIAKLRHVAFRMATFACSSNKEEFSLSRQILMGMKTARAWIDCQHFDRAEKVLDMLDEMTEALLGLVVKREGRAAGIPGTQDRQAAEENLFRIFCCRAEVFSGQNRHEEALKNIQMAKELLGKFPKERGLVCMLCFNFGVKTYHDKHYKVCTTWLRESFDLGKEAGSVSAKNQARTLRLLANTYLEWNEPGCLEQALNAVNLANSMATADHVSVAGLFLKLRIMLKSRESLASIKALLEQLMKHPDTGIDLCHNIILLLQKNCGDLVSCPLESCSLERFHPQPDHGRLMIAYLDLLLRMDNQGAKTFAKDCIVAQSTDSPVDATTMRQLHVLFWEQAAQHYQEKTYSDALDWYGFSLSLFRSAGGRCDLGCDNLSKLYRNLANCYIGLQQLDQARVSLKDALDADPSSAHSHYLVYKVALHQSDSVAAQRSLEALVDSLNNSNPRNTEDCNTFITLAAQMAIEHKRETLASLALSSVLSHMPDPYQVLRALRCLVRLSTSTVEDININRDKLAEVLSYVRTATNKLLVMSDCDEVDMDAVRKEAEWFVQTAWNLAIKLENDPDNMKEFFMLCYRLLGLCEPAGKDQSHMETCVLMATAACIQIARTAVSEDHRKCLLEEALSYIAEYKSLEARPLESSSADRVKHSAQTLMLLYEFEALVKLNDSRAETVLERTLVIHTPSPKLFESIAALAVDPPACQPRLCVRALKVAIHTHLQSQEPDFVRCSQDVHQLLERSLRCNEEEAFSYFTETADLLDTRAQGQYPQMETVWLMTKSWNTGIRHFSLDNFVEAEKWCAVSMRLLPHVGSLRETYEEQMMSVYSEILEGMERMRSSPCLEE